MQRDPAQVGAGQDLQAPRLDGRVLEVVVQRDRLRPGRHGEWVVPAHPILMPVERWRLGLLGEHDDEGAESRRLDGLEISETQSLQCRPGLEEGGGVQRRRMLCVCFGS